MLRYFRFPADLSTCERYSNSGFEHVYLYIFIILFKKDYISLNQIRMMIEFVVVVVVVFCFFFCGVAPTNASPVPSPAVDLRVEYVPVPVVGVTVQRPRFSWSLGNHPTHRGVFQSGYHITIKNDLTGENIWDSGYVNSNNTLGIQTPVKVESDSSYTFNVVWFDNMKTPSPISTGHFTTAFLKQSDWGNATWITIPDTNDARNQFRTVLHLPDGAVVKRATCFIAGLGYQRSWLNGKRLGHRNNTLGQFLQFQRRVPYETYDISNLLKEGKNVLAILIGRGWYSLPEDNFTAVLGYKTIGPRALKAVCLASLNDGRKLRFSTGSGVWRFSAGEIVFNHLFLGETIDKRKETVGWKDRTYDDSKWDIVNNNKAKGHNDDPSGRLTSFIMPPVQKHMPRSPVSIQRLDKKGDVQFVLDFEVNQAMQCTLRFDSDGTNEGITLRLHHAEQVDANGDIVISNDLGGVQDQTTFVLSNSSGLQVFETKFSYFGARYVKISGWPKGKKDPTPDSMTCFFVHTNLAAKSSIKFYSPNSSDTATILNGIRDITIRSALSNYMSTPTDCPSREKRGWTGDGQSAAETLIYSFDMASSYPKWLADIVDAQQCNFGATTKERSCPVDDPFCRIPGDQSNIPEITPFMFGSALNACENGSDPAWGSGFIALMDWVYRYYGDLQTLKWHYSAGAAYLEYLLRYVNTTSSGSFLLDLNYPTTRYGDWCAALPIAHPTSRHTSNLINGFFWLKQLRIMEFAAKTLGFVEDEKKWSELAEHGAESYNKLYFSGEKGLYQDIECINSKDRKARPCHNSSINADSEMSIQTAQALPLFLELPASKTDRIRVGNALAEDVIHGTYPGRTTTGLVGTKYVLSELVKSGHANVALKIATNMQYPSWGRMLPKSVHPLGQGEGTLWERWEGDKHTGVGSRNHIMLGGFDGPFFYGNLAGIQNHGIAWSNVVIAPTVAGDLTGIDATVATVRGNIKVKWNVLEGSIHHTTTNKPDFFINVSIPSGTIGTVKIPLLHNSSAKDVQILEGGVCFWKAGGAGYRPNTIPGIDSAKAGFSIAGNFIAVDIRSGTYKFSLIAS